MNNSKGNKRIGHTVKMNCGMNATVIKYNNADNITIKFEDGTIRTGVRYRNFIVGRVSPVHRKHYNHNRLGEKRVMNCGMEAVIIRYNNSLDVDVSFNNGDISEHCTYDNFVKGRIKPSSCHKTKNIAPNVIMRGDKYKKRIGEKQLQNCGLVATIIDYKNSLSVDVEFEDGSRVYCRKYDDFKRGRIKSPLLRSSRFKDRTGEVRVMNCGLSATIIEYHSSNNMTVQFENGDVRKGVFYSNFKAGLIRPLNK